MIPMHPQLRRTLEMTDSLVSGFAHIADVGYERARRRLRQRRAIGQMRHPGHDTPYWNVFAAQLRQALRPHGAKAKMARYLGLPRQRITDFVSARRRLPDAEITLRLLHWLAVMEKNRDLTT
jgi:hypothetical protein